MKERRFLFVEHVLIVRVKEVLVVLSLLGGCDVTVFLPRRSLSRRDQESLLLWCNNDDSSMSLESGNVDHRKDRGHHRVVLRTGVLVIEFWTPRLNSPSFNVVEFKYT